MNRLDYFQPEEAKKEKDSMAVPLKDKNSGCVFGTHMIRFETVWAYLFVLKSTFQELLLKWCHQAG